ncbi:MAG: DUF1524 domain-containing protein [Actinomycetes bacterium]
MLRTSLDRARRGVPAVAALVIAGAMVLSACAQPATLAVGAQPGPTQAVASPSTSPLTPNPPTPASPTPASSPSAGTAEAAALELTVKGRAPKTGYSRDQFGDGWVDVDRNGCDTRNDMLGLRLSATVMSGTCRVLEGRLEDPFTGATLRFVRGGDSEVDIDHLVALSDAWQKGAASWEFAQRVAFANDPLNLEPVDAGQNRAKGDGDAATWLPPNRDFRCAYVARQVAVKAKYGVWVTQAELDAMLRVLGTCPGEPLPAPGDQPVLADNVGRAPSAPAEPSSDTAASADPVSEPDPDMGTCTAAKAAGYGPYVRGEDVEYGYYRDGDSDGTVCE